VMLRHRLDGFTGALRSQRHDMVSDEKAGDEALDASSVSLSEDLPVAAVDHELLDDIARIAGDIDGSRSRLEQQVGAFREGLQDMHAGIRTLRQELDGLRMHTGALRMPHDPADPGEMPPHAGRAPPVADIFQHLDRLAANLSALSELRDSIESIVGDSRSVLVQQARDHVALEQRLNHSRMQPLDTRLENLCAELTERAAHAGKQVLLRVDAGELRIEPEKMAALLPVLRSLTASMTDAGVEPPRARVLAGLTPGCLMEMRFKRRGADLDMVLTGDCKAPAGAAVAEARAFLRPLGGRLELEATGKSETRCKLQMPLAPRVSTVLLVAVGGEILALPLGEVTAVLQLSAEELAAGEEAGIEHGNQRWQLGRLSALLALGAQSRRDPASRQPLVLVAADSGRHALVVDAIGERVDVVVRSVVPQLRSVSGLAGAAILGDGQVVLLLDVGQLVESRSEHSAAEPESVS
jgi:chemosensory pili system protein ChpA (sensor histidine kinase/response regulator)